MMELQKMEIRFEGEELASYTDRQGVTYRLLWNDVEEYYVIHNDDPEGPAWLEDGRGAGFTELDIRLRWPELAAGLH
jgi:hypothetical protein